MRKSAITAALIARFPIKRGAGKKMFACVFVFGVATIAFGLSHVFALSLLALFVTGLVYYPPHWGPEAPHAKVPDWLIFFGRFARNCRTFPIHKQKKRVR